MSRIIKVRGIVICENKLLLVRLKPYKDKLKKQNDFWCLPGGTLEEAETIQDGLLREMVEETGVRPEIGHLSYIQQFSQDNKDYLEFLFYIKNAEDYLNIDLSQTTHGAAEIEELGFKHPESVSVLPKFLASEPMSDIVSGSSPTKIYTII